VTGGQPVERWRIVSPAGKESTFETLDEMREALAAGKIAEEPRSDRIEVLTSDLEAAPSSREARERREARDVSVHEQPTLELPAITVVVHEDGTEEIQAVPRGAPPSGAASNGAAPSDPALHRPITLKRPFAPGAADPAPSSVARTEPPASRGAGASFDDAAPRRTGRGASALAIALAGAAFVVFLVARTEDPTSPSAVPPALAAPASRDAAPAGSAEPARVEPASPAADPAASPAPTAQGGPASPGPAGAPASQSAPITAARVAGPSKQDAALAAFRAGDYARARLLYDDLLAARPDDESTLAALGDTLRAQGDRGGAEQFYKRAITANSRYVPARLGLADVTWDGGDHTSARSMYADIVAQFPIDVVPDRARQRAIDGATSPLTP